MAESRLITAAIATLLLAGGLTVGALLTADESGRANGGFGVPALSTDATASYNATGTFRELFREPILNHPEGGPAEGPITVLLGTNRSIPNALGEPVETTVLQVHREDRLLLSTAATQEGPLVTLVGAAIPHQGDEPFDPLANLDYGIFPHEGGADPDASILRLDLGFAEAFLLAGERIPGDPTPITDVLSRAAMISPDHVDLADVTIHADGRTVYVQDSGGPLASYTYEPGCPLPAVVTYEEGEGLDRFVLELTACEQGSAVPQGSGTGWQAIPTGPFDRAFPGEGEDLPLPYRDALDFFLSLPRAQLFQEANPDWLLHCASVWKHHSDSEAREAWTWRFDLHGSTGTATGWITRLDFGLDSPGPWSEDPDPPDRADQNPCVSSNPEDMDGATAASMDGPRDAFEAILDETVWSEEAVWDSVVAGPYGHMFTLDRCIFWLDQQGGGICTNWAPNVDFNHEGRLAFVKVELPWLSDAFDPLASTGS